MVLGLSDHTLGTEVPVAKVSIGARIIEKHLTLWREEEKPDSDFSLEPDEFAEMVHSVRRAEKALGEVRYETTEMESESETFRRSLFVVEDVEKGEWFTEENVQSTRPRDDMSPKHITSIKGRRSSQRIAAETPLRMRLVR